MKPKFSQPNKVSSNLVLRPAENGSVDNHSITIFFLPKSGQVAKAQPLALAGAAAVVVAVVVVVVVVDVAVAVDDVDVVV